MSFAPNRDRPADSRLFSWPASSAPRCQSIHHGLAGCAASLSLCRGAVL